VQHVVGVVIELKHLPFLQLFVAAEKYLLLALHLFLCLSFLLLLLYHCVRLVVLSLLMFGTGLTDPPLLLLELILKGIFELLIGRQFLIEDRLIDFRLLVKDLLSGRLNLAGRPAVLLVLDDFGVVFELLVLASVHC
jgi:hypothetical protein